MSGLLLGFKKGKNYQNIQKYESEEFSNSSNEHAAIVMAAIFNNSKEVSLYANDLSGAVSNRLEYREALDKFLTKVT